MLQKRILHPILRLKAQVNNPNFRKRMTQINFFLLLIFTLVFHRDKEYTLIQHFVNNQTLTDRSCYFEGIVQIKAIFP